MIAVFSLQFALPLILIGCIAIAPLRSRTMFLLQLAATAAALVAIGLAGIWILPPWWSPYVSGMLFLFALAIVLRRRKAGAKSCRRGMVAWAATAFYVGLGAFALYVTTMALGGRNLPAGPVVELAFPMDDGTYLVANGGSHISVNAHLKTLDQTVPRYRAWRGQSHGLDIVKIDALGRRASGLLPRDPAAYRIYGTKVLAPCAGEIIFARDDLPDLLVPDTDRSHMAGNHIVLRCLQADIVLGHLRPHSVKLAIGAMVEVGTPLAEIGNSGNTDEPHLHIHAQGPWTATEPMAAAPFPIRFGGRYLVRNDRVSVP